MLTTTAGQIIESALDKIGIRGAGQAVGGDDLAHCLGLLNDLCDELKLGPSFAYRQGEVVHAIGAGVSSVTIGPGAAINTDRPDRLEIGSFTRVGSEDFPLTIGGQAEYNSARLKTNGGARPIFAYYDAAVPVGRIYLWPLAACELHLIVRTHVGQFVDTETQYVLPTGYKSLLSHTLAEVAAPTYEVAVPAPVAAKAKNLRATVRRGNLRVPELRFGNSPAPTVEAAFFGGD